MLHNPLFTDQQPTAPEVLACIERLMKHQQEVMRTNFTKVALRDENLRMLKEHITRWADYVNWKASGHLDILLASGLPLARPAEKHPLPGKVERLVIAGECIHDKVKVHWSGVKGRVYYKVETADEEVYKNNKWTTDKITTDNTCELTGYEKLKDTYVRVSAVNVSGQGEWSNMGRTMFY